MVTTRLGDKERNDLRASQQYGVDMRGKLQTASPPSGHAKAYSLGQMSACTLIRAHLRMGPQVEMHCFLPCCDRGDQSRDGAAASSAVICGVECCKPPPRGRTSWHDDKERPRALASSRTGSYAEHCTIRTDDRVAPFDKFSGRLRRVVQHLAPQRLASRIRTERRRPATTTGPVYITTAHQMARK